MQDDIVVRDSLTVEVPVNFSELNVPVMKSHRKLIKATDKTIINRTLNTGVIALMIKI
jgi:hypothetical protein